MKEYEYIIKGIESFLVDELVGVICQESLVNGLYPDGFRRIFDNYLLLRKDIVERISVLGAHSSFEPDLSALEEEWKGKREDFLESFLQGVDDNYSDLNIRQFSKKYQEGFSSEDVMTTEKRVCIYPYLIAQVRLHEKRKFENGNNN